MDLERSMMEVSCGLWLVACGITSLAVVLSRGVAPPKVLTSSPPPPEAAGQTPPVAHKRTTVRHLLTSTPQAQCNGAVSLSQWLLMQMPKFRFLPVYFFS